ncbi:hypothetical protein L1887_25598 [Cichorium endivia]|nr:hypothetical protein L1887_25598 [Cichorium endivia]
MPAVFPNTIDNTILSGRVVNLLAIANGFADFIKLNRDNPIDMGLDPNQLSILMQKGEDVIDSSDKSNSIVAEIVNGISVYHNRNIDSISVEIIPDKKSIEVVDSMVSNYANDLEIGI